MLRWPVSFFRSYDLPNIIIKLYIRLWISRPIFSIIWQGKLSHHATKYVEDQETVITKQSVNAVEPMGSTEEAGATQLQVHHGATADE